MLRWLRQKMLVSNNYLPDYRGIPTLECPCGSDLVLLACVFDPETNLPGMFMLDAKCAMCGALLTMKTPLELDDTDGFYSEYDEYM